MYGPLMAHVKTLLAGRYSLHLQYTSYNYVYTAPGITIYTSLLSSSNMKPLLQVQLCL